MNAVASCALNPKGVYHAGAMVWICPAPWSETKRSELENESGSKLYGQPVQKRTRIINYQKRAPVARLFSEKDYFVKNQKDFPTGMSNHICIGSLHRYREHPSVCRFQRTKEEEFA